MEDREKEIRGRLFRSFGGPCYTELDDPWRELLKDAKYLIALLDKARVEHFKSLNAIRDEHR